MPRFSDDNDTEYDRDADRLGLEEPDVTCLRCQTRGLHWRMVTQPDGRSEKPVLFQDGRRHVCHPSADDFEVIA